MGDMSEYRAELYEAYVGEREKLNSAALDVAARYDRTILALSAGTLVLSVTFLEKIMPAPVPWTIFILIPGWLLLLVSVLTQLFALSSSQYAVQKQIEWLDEDYSKYFTATDLEASVRAGQLKQSPENPYVVETKRYNQAARWTLVLGLLCIFTFSASNMYFRKEIANARREQRTNTPTGETATTGTATGKAATTATTTADRGQTSEGVVHATKKPVTPSAAPEKRQLDATQR
jgi:hypothetical protein